MQLPSRLALSVGAAIAFGLSAVALSARPTVPGTMAAGDSAGRPPVVAGRTHAHGPSSGDTVTAAARAQLARARRAAAALATTEAARAAGFRPMFGYVPLQGVHYVRVDRVLADTFDVERPSVLLFAPVKGKQTLVGVAYAFLHPTDSAPPAGFDGAGDAWHSHDGLTQVPGRHLVMMHAWFVDAPGGPFARQNAWLPYLAAGLTPPSEATLADSAAGERARRLGFALASTKTPPMLFEWLARQGGAAVRSRADSARTAIAALVPRLAAAERAGDDATRERLATEAIRHGDALAAAYRDAMPTRPIVRRLVDRTVDEFLGRGHGIEEELSALLQGGAAAAGGDAPHAHTTDVP